MLKTSKLKNLISGKALKRAALAAACVAAFGFTTVGTASEADARGCYRGGYGGYGGGYGSFYRGGWGPPPAFYYSGYRGRGFGPGYYGGYRGGPGFYRYGGRGGVTFAIGF